MRTRPSTGIVIPTLGRVTSTAELCQELAEQAPTAELVVPVFQRASEYEAFTGKVHPANVMPVLTTNRGAGPARNAGVEALPESIENVAFLDDDVRPTHGDWLSSLTEPLHDPAVKACTGPILGWDTHRRFRVLPPWRASLVLPLVFHPLGDPEFPRSARVGTVWGGNFAVRRVDFLRVGGFDRRFMAPSLFEETEFSLRLRRVLGGYLRYVVEAPVYHHQAMEGGQRDQTAALTAEFVVAERLKLLRVLRETDGRPLAAQRTRLATALIKTASARAGRARG